MVAPIGTSGIALVGDTNKFVTLGTKRVSTLTDGGGALHATVAFAAGETNVTLAGYAPSAPYLTIRTTNTTAVSPFPVSPTGSCMFFRVK